MIRFALKGLLGRKLRTALTALAIVLGVAMISGTYVLTDSIDSAFDTIFTEVREGSSAVVTGKAAFDLSDGSGATAPAFPESVLTTVRGVDGVAAAEGSVDSDSTTLIGRDGKAVVNGGAPNLGFAIAQGESPFNPLALVEGDWPGPNEVVIDSGTAKDEDFKIGDVVGVQAEGPVEMLKVSGIVRLNASISIGGATLAGFDLPTAQRLFKKVGKLDEIAVAAASGTTDAQLVENISAVLPPGTQVRSGQAQAADDAADTNEFITFLQGFLLAFAGIALFVGSFVIANSLSITIAQRAREFATVRTLGGSRRQILNSIIIEALVVGTARVRRRPLPRARPRETALLALRPRRLHAPEQRPALRDADDRRLAGRRDHRDAAREPPSRHPCDARAPDRRRPRGGDAAAVALRPFPHGSARS